MNKDVTHTIFLLLVISFSAPSLAAHKKANLQFLAANSSFILLSYIADYAENLDQQIASSEESCFQQGYQTDFQWQQLSYFLQNHLQGELFSADYCQHFSGQRFYADNGNTERWDFIHSKSQNKKAHGFIETCRNCFQQDSHLMRSNMHITAPPLSLQLDIKVEESNTYHQQHSWRISGSYSLQHQHEEQCNFKVLRLETIQPLQVKGQSLSLWNSSKQLPSYFLKGELLMELEAQGIVHVRYERNKLWVNHKRVNIEEIEAERLKCYESKSPGDRLLLS